MSAKTQKLVKKLAEIEKQVSEFFALVFLHCKACFQLKKEGIYIPEPEQDYGAVTKQVRNRIFECFKK